MVTRSRNTALMVSCQDQSDSGIIAERPIVGVEHQRRAIVGQSARRLARNDSCEGRISFQCARTLVAEARTMPRTADADLADSS